MVRLPGLLTPRWSSNRYTGESKRIDHHEVQLLAMQQIKIFKAVDSEIGDLESQINRFLRKNKVRVLSISGNHSPSPAQSAGPMNTFSGGDVTIIMLFEVDEAGR